MVYSPFTITGDGVTAVRFVESKFVAHSRENPPQFVGQDRIMFAPCTKAANCGPGGSLEYLQIPLWLRALKAIDFIEGVVVRGGSAFFSRAPERIR
jgi:hypothetical protein